MSSLSRFLILVGIVVCISTITYAKTVYYYAVDDADIYDTYSLDNTLALLPSDDYETTQFGYGGFGGFGGYGGYGGYGGKKGGVGIPALPATIKGGGYGGGFGGPFGGPPGSKKGGNLNGMNIVIGVPTPVPTAVPVPQLMQPQQQQQQPPEEPEEEEPEEEPEEPQRRVRVRAQPQHQKKYALIPQITNTKKPVTVPYTTDHTVQVPVTGKQQQYYHNKY